MFCKKQQKRELGNAKRLCFFHKQLIMGLYVYCYYSYYYHTCETLSETQSNQVLWYSCCSFFIWEVRKRQNVFLHIVECLFCRCKWRGLFCYAWIVLSVLQSLWSDSDIDHCVWVYTKTTHWPALKKEIIHHQQIHLDNSSFFSFVSYKFTESRFLNTSFR